MKENNPSRPPKNVQAFYYLLIFLAGGMMVWEKSRPEARQRLWFLLLWFAVMLYAFYKATRNWAHDNPKPSKEELLEEARRKAKEKPPEIRDTRIPDLTEMVKNLKDKRR